VLSPGFIVLRLIDIYLIIIFVWCLGSWVPQWRYQEWYRMLGSVVEPYVNLFRGLGLNYGGLDLSPFIACIALQVFGMVLSAALSGGITW
jgi:YggT family protein